MSSRTLPHVVPSRKSSPLPVSQLELRAFLLSIVDIDRRETQLKRFEAGLAKRLRAGAAVLPGQFTARLLRRRGRIFVEVL